jgi:acetolactate decarboxylase
MNKKIIFALIVVGLLAVSAVSAQNSLFLGNDNNDAMNQVSLMQAFMHGEYNGVVTVGDFKAHGDTGLGTFEGVNGEMIVLTVLFIRPQLKEASM